MSNITFGEYIRKRREEINLPLRKAITFLNIDTSTLRKVDRRKQLASLEYLKPISEILGLDLKKCRQLTLQKLEAKTFVNWDI